MFSKTFVLINHFWLHNLWVYGPACVSATGILLDDPGKACNYENIISVLRELVVTVFPFILSNTLGKLMFAYLSGKQYTKKSRNMQYHSVSQFSGKLWWVLCQYSRGSPALINQTPCIFSIAASDFYEGMTGTDDEQ